MADEFDAGGSSRATRSTSTSTTWTATGCSRGTRSASPIRPALIAELGRRGMRCVTIVDPGVKLDAGQRRCSTQDSSATPSSATLTAHHVTGSSGPAAACFPDFLRPDVRDWWGDLHAVLVDAGVAGIWNDMNEPALYAKPVGTDVDGTLVEVPTDAPQGPAGHRVGHGEVHNVYGLSMARAASEALATLRPDARSFSLTRSGLRRDPALRRRVDRRQHGVVGAPAHVVADAAATSASPASRSSARTSAASGATPPPSCTPAGSRPACCTR